MISQHLNSRPNTSHSFLKYVLLKDKKSNWTCELEDDIPLFFKKSFLYHPLSLKKRDPKAESEIDILTQNSFLKNKSYIPL
jgi:hypothetical protein